MGLSSQLPWYFRPLPVIGAYLGIVVAIIGAEVSAQSTVSIAFGSIAFALWALLFSWPYLLYIHLAPSAGGTSKHRSGRNDRLFLVTAAFLVLACLLTFFTPNTRAPNEPADFLSIPIMVCWLLLVWRASDLLAELEMRKPIGYEGRVTPTVVAMIVLPLTIGWFYSRLTQLHAKGRI